MKFIIRRKIVSIKNDYIVKNSLNNVAYVFKSGYFFQKRIKVYDSSGDQKALIKKKWFRISPKYAICLENGEQVIVKKTFGLFNNDFIITSEDYQYIIEGNVYRRIYDLILNGQKIASVSRDTTSIMHGYDVNINLKENVLAVLSIIVVVHMAHYSNIGVRYRDKFFKYLT